MNASEIIANLDKSEQIKLWMELQKSLQWFAFGVLCVEDVIDEMHQRELTIPADTELVSYACEYVARKYEFDHSHAIDWAIEKIEEERECE